MPFRLFVPLPGPFAWTSRSRAERHHDQQQRAAARANQTPADRRVRLLWLVGAAFGLTTLALVRSDLVLLGLAVALIGGWLLCRGIVTHLDLREEEDAAADEAVAAHLRRRGWIVDDD